MKKAIPPAALAAAAAVLLALAFFAGATYASALQGKSYGCGVQTLFSPGAEPAIVSLFSSSERSISVEIYQFSYTPLSEELERKASQGVQVRVILDRTVTTNYATARELASKGVLVRFAPEHFARLHSKFAVIDSAVVLVGSTNWSFHAMFLNREAAVALSGCGTVSQFDSVFEEDWAASEPFLS
ncbi:MAG: phospholipase D-like domain-containing protein [Candidatus Micrarchaeia archaeon]